MSPAEVRLNVSDMCTTDNITAGFQCWNTDRDILDQYEMFNGMPVYYGGDMYDSEDSEWDDPYALASAAYVEDYNFDVPEGMDLMVHRQSRIRDGSDAQRDECQTVSCVMRNGLDVFDDDSLTEAADAGGPDMDDFCQRVVSSDKEDFVVSDDGSITDFNWDMSEEEELMDSDEGSVADLDSDRSDVEVCCDSDVGSVADLEWNTWDVACALAFQGAVGAFPPEAAVIQSAVVFRDILFREEECDTAVVLARGEVPMSPVLPVTDKRVAMIPPVTNRHVQQTSSESVGGDAYNVRLCLLYSDSVEDLQDLRDGYVDSQRLNHWHTVSWDAGIADSQVLSVCHDCLCLMSLFRAVMSLRPGEMHVLTQMMT